MKMDTYTKKSYRNWGYQSPSSPYLSLLVEANVDHGTSAAFGLPQHPSNGVGGSGVEWEVSCFGGGATEADVGGTVEGRLVAIDEGGSRNFGEGELCRRRRGQQG